MKLGMQIGIGPGHIVLDEDPAPPPQRGTAPPPNFRPISVAAKWLDGSRCHLDGMEVGLGPGDCVGWLCGPAVEHRSLAGVLSLSCARLVADG